MTKRTLRPVNKKAFYTMTGSALLIGALFAGGAFVTIFVDAPLSHTTKSVVGWMCMACLVAFVLSTIYIVLDIMSIFWEARKGTQSTPIPQIQPVEPIATAEQVEDNSEQINTTEQAEETEVPEAETLSEEELDALAKQFQEYVNDKYKSFPVYKAIRAMFDPTSSTKRGANYAAKVFRVAKSLGWIDSIPIYKSANEMFGEQLIGKRSAYNQYVKEEDIFDRKDDFLDIGKSLKGKMKALVPDFKMPVQDDNDL